MEFTKKEVTVIYAMINVCIQSLQFNKKHKSKNDILVQKELEDIKRKIDLFLEGEKKE